MKKRILGIDVARALAIFGMIVVNFKVVFGDNGAEWVKTFASFFDGKAAATFVVLAGVGIALMTNAAIESNDTLKLHIARKRIAKRAAFLFIVGLSYIVVWPADILHYYGIYMFIILLLLTRSKKTILAAALLLIIAFPILLFFLNYENGWNFDTLEYRSFWTLNGFIRNLFFNGFHPVIPWTAFMLIGFWFGKQDLNNTKFVNRIFWISTSVFIVIQIISNVSISFLANGDQASINQLSEILGTNPMPPLPIYMLSGITIALAIISACITVSKRFENSFIIDSLNKTGQLALSFYVAHVVLGMGVIAVLNPNMIGNSSIEFSVVYALCFSVLCILFAITWLKFKKSGPLEWVMRKLTD